MYLQLFLKHVVEPEVGAPPSRDFWHRRNLPLNFADGLEGFPSVGAEIIREAVDGCQNPPAKWRGYSI